MEQDNTEDLIKEVIGHREIAPSEDARERLIKALNSRPKERRGLWLRYGIAASIAITLCFVGAKMIMENIEGSEPIPRIVNDDKPPIIRQKPSGIQEELESMSSDSPNNIVSVQESSEISKAKTEVVTAKTEREPQELSKQKKGGLTNVESEFLESRKEIIVKIDTVLTAVPNQFLYITAEDLLASSSTDSILKLNRKLKKPSENYVESGALLLEIERQLFDEKNKGIFSKATRNLKKVKKALANRNYKDNN